MNAHDRPWLSPAEIADEVGVSPRTVLRWLRGGLPSRKLGKRTIRVRRVDFEAFVTSPGASPAATAEPSPIDEARRIRARAARRGR